MEPVHVSERGVNIEPPTREAVIRLRDQLCNLRAAMRRLEAAFEMNAIHPKQQASARNILDYVALRQQDLRTLQDELTHWGFSSLGRCEAHVRNNIDAVLSLLHQLTPDVAPCEPLERTD
jgi:pyruvate kinase